MKKLIFLLLAILVIWIDIPFTIPVKFQVLGKKVDTKIETFAIRGKIFGKDVNKSFETKLGLDLKGGSHLLFEADMSKIPAADRESALESARDIIERRVNFFGVSEPTIQSVKNGDQYRIAVDMPGIEDAGGAVRLIGQTAQLEFKEEIASSEAKIATDTPLINLLKKPTGLKGTHVKKASVVFGQSNGAPSVSLQFNEEGGKIFAEVTKRNLGKPVAIYLDNFILSAPVVQAVITSGDAVISGNFTVDEAKNLAVAINSGALPVPIKLIEQRNIGPTLGQEAVTKSIQAGIIGLSSVVLFMIFYYGQMGMIAAVALLIYGLISFAIFRAIPIVLTLPGIAGFILSIGMAVDSNILIFERIKEEQRKGRDFDTALRIGFGKALDAIKDANIATLLVAFILFNPFNWSFFPQFGLIRGFALTLAIGVGTSLFTGVVITKRLIDTLYRGSRGDSKGLAIKGVPQKKI